MTEKTYKRTERFLIIAVILSLIFALVACGDNLPPPPDAAPLPTCAEVGCPDNALCNSAGRCVCRLPYGLEVTCTIGAAP